MAAPAVSPPHVGAGVQAADRLGGPAGDELYELIVDNLPQSAVFVFDADLRFVFAGGRALQVGDLSDDAVRGHLVRDVVDASSWAVLEPAYRRALAGEDVELELRGENRPRLYRVRISPVRVRGLVIAGLAVTDDVTELRHDSVLETQARTRWEQLFVNAPTGMWLSDPGPTGRLLDVNPALCQLLQLSRQQILAGSKASLLQVPDADVLTDAFTAVNGGAGVTLERTVLRGDGSTVHVSVTATLLDDPAGQRILAHFTDLTAVRNTEEQLRSAVSFQEAVLKVIPDPIHVADPTTGEHTWSTANSNLVPPVHPGDRGIIEASIRAVASAGDGEVVHARHRAVAADGSLRWLDRRKTPFRRGTGGNVELYVGITRDVTDQVAAEAELRESVAFQEAVLASSPDIVTVFDLGSMQSVWASRSLVDVLGEDLEAVRDKQERGMDTLIHPDDWVTFQRCTEESRHLADAQVAVVEFRLQHRDGTWHILERRSTPFKRDDAGLVTQLLNVTRDVTTQRSTAVELDERRAFQEAVISTTPDVVLLVDSATGRLTWTSRPVDDLLGWRWEELQALGDAPLETLLHPDSVETFRNLERAADHAEHGQVVQATYQARHRDGTWRWISRRMTPFTRSSSGEVTQSLVIVRDVTSVVEARHQLEHAALHDPLTSLPNRVLVVDRLHNALAATSRGGHVAVLYLDLDGFKRINDAYGHAAGDAVLVATADRLTQVVRPADTVGRMGGDEFVVVLQRADSDIVETLARSISERLREKLAEPVVHDGIAHTVTCSVGITTATNADLAENVLRNADSAMYQAKTGGKNRLAVFDPDQFADAVHRSTVEQCLRAAIRDEAIDVLYQPIVRTTDGSVAGAEALVRIRDANGTYLDTQHAVQIAEQTGLIGAIGRQVLVQACRQATLWADDTTIAVNLSAAEIAIPDLYSRIQAVLTETDLPPRRLVIELTETVLLTAARSTTRDLERLRDAGIGIAIDDFGTGYASLRYLTTLPATCVKVDRSFTAGLGTDPVSTTLVRAVVQLSHDLQLDCIVEGVETSTQLDLLGSHPRLYAQGYHLGRPAAATPTIDELAQGTSAAVDARTTTDHR